MSASDEEERLVEHIFKGYNQLVRPVRNLTSSPVEISFSLALVLLINVDEKNQIMQTNVWPTMVSFLTIDILERYVISEMA